MVQFISADGVADDEYYINVNQIAVIRVVHDEPSKTEITLNCGSKIVVRASFDTFWKAMEGHGKDVEKGGTIGLSLISAVD
jgi:uncharacterized protein YlzI (FlbEa/FlbD family)